VKINVVASYTVGQLKDIWVKKKTDGILPCLLTFLPKLIQKITLGVVISNKPNLMERKSIFAVKGIRQLVRCKHCPYHMKESVCSCRTPSHFSPDYTDRFLDFCCCSLVFYQCKGNLTYIAIA